MIAIFLLVDNLVDKLAGWLMNVCNGKDQDDVVNVNVIYYV
jgi:hypothetical protein